MAIQTHTDGSGNEFTEVWGGQPGAPTLILTLNTNGITLGDGLTLNGQIASSGENADFLTVTAATSVQTPLKIAGNADGATARTGGLVRAPDVTGATTNVAGADLTIGAGVGHGSGTPGNVLIKAAPAAASGNNAQTRATVVTVSSAGAAVTGTLSASGVSTLPTIVGGSAVGSDLTLQSTSGSGDGSDTIVGKVGNNGATTVFVASAASFAVTGSLSCSTTFGCNGATPQAPAAFVADGTDAGTTQTLANALKAMAIAFGFMAAS